jgi:signal transduction histidine kinase
MAQRLVGRGSLARRLFASAATLTLAILLMAGLVLSGLHRNYAVRTFDDLLDIYMKALIADIAVNSDSGDQSALGDLGEPRFRTPLSGWYWQVTKLSPDNSQTVDVQVSPSLFAGRLPHGDASGKEPFARARTVVATGVDERPLRMVESYIDIGEQGRYLVAVAADLAEVNDEVRGFNWALFVTFGALALALLGSAMLQVRFGLRPIGQLRRALAAIRRGEADRIEGDFPTEIAPLTEELNQLVSTNREIVERARTQVGNLAHALKTPLSVLMNEAETAKGPLATKVREQSTLMNDQVQHYLDRARAATRAVAIGANTPVEPVLQRLVRVFSRIHGEKGVAFRYEAEPGLTFRGERQDLEELLGNLADNAGKWAKSTVVITARRLPVADGGRPMMALGVVDDGPGLPQHMRSEALQRGRRLDESKPGSGLGLSIVHDLATMYAGTLALGDGPEGGLAVSVTLPAIDDKA